MKARKTPLKRKTLDKAYEPGNIEQKWYSFWLKNGYFTPKVDPARAPFVIIMPPPNVTGELHVGHALTMTVEDVLIRWHRMLGDPTLWVPGTDHSGIAVQVLVEKDLAKEGLTRQQVGREEFLHRAWERAIRSRKTIEQQQHLIGASCDWTRDTFTLDAGPSKAVRTAFTRLYRKGLIYRGERMVNWCPRCQTALSDLEVEHKDTPGHLWHFRYPFAEGEGSVTIATTRPETCYGDTAVAVNPNDERYRAVVGRSVILPVTGRPIPVIADEAVDPAFGTGALKITPCHDPTDLEIADRHNLAHVDVFNQDGSMNAEAGTCQGMTREACRERVVREFEEKGLLTGITPYNHMVGHCGRCGAAVEPRISTQWFVRTQPLAEAAIRVVRNGEIRIIPEHFTRVYYSWMESIKDWCISRQLWWGHRIPVWYCLDCGALTVSVDTPTVCEKCTGNRLEQDPDVLDTWFSSALWTHSTLGWPDDTEDMRYFYPTSVMQTGYDILFFWVARMIMMGIEDTGRIPFHTVYLNGLIRDEQGQKMSKMRGNVIKPDDAIASYGIDALRFALTTGNSPGNDLSLGKAKLESSRNFVNKLWNATRFVLQSTEEWRSSPAATSPLPTPQRIEDRWLLSRAHRLITAVRSLMDDYQIGEAERQIHDFVWTELCDWYIEVAKLRLRAKDTDPAAPSPAPYLVSVLDMSLRLLHPFMPFVTEELWQHLQPAADDGEVRSIIVAPAPVADDAWLDPDAERSMSAAQDIVRTLRNTRTERKMEPADWLEARLYTGTILSDLQQLLPAIEMLSRTHILSLEHRDSRAEEPTTGGALVLSDAEIIVADASPEHVDRVREQLQKEAETTRNRLQSIDARLVDEAFLSKAPPAVVEKQRELASGLRDKLARLEAELQELD
ncbi:MAG: valine--tRNA ligase [Dehalococcoidia bacterium]|nr:valine--tRNA ligase [Dehalococcoidia bacterium]